jgi:phosphoribosylformylglycinamidine synthase PurS subunit
MRVRVYVTLKPSVFDPQGKTVTDALHSLGYSAISDVRQGKFFEFDVDAVTEDEARAVATQAAGAVLANPVIESFRVEIDQTVSASAGAPS